MISRETVPTCLHQALKITTSQGKHTLNLLYQSHNKLSHPTSILHILLSINSHHQVNSDMIQDLQTDMLLRCLLLATAMCNLN